MAATMIGGAFLSATVQTLVEKLASTEFLDYIKNTKLNDSLLRQLQTTLLTLQVVLDDAEEKQINNPAVKQWLDGLKDAVFDAEDLLHEISYDSLRCTMESKQAGNRSNQVWNFLLSPFNSFYREINSQMKIMCESLQHFEKRKDILRLQTKSTRVSRRTPSSSVVNESVMVGRKDDKETIMNMLLSKRETTDNNIGVVAILGMGGLGKTTLAQLVYNDKEVQQHFDLKAWVCVSEDFDIMRVTKSLLESATSITSESNNLDVLRVELKKISREKRYLFVLDDLWNDNYNDWGELVSPFIDGKPGSMVIITTRQEKVAEVAHTFPIHKLDLLSNEDCWTLLSKHALGNDEFHNSTNTTLEEIGRKIARKCGGLPIAAKTLGGLLRSKVDITEWTSILNSNIWNLRNDNILPALHLSYQYLPSHLKRCFAYCSIFPKDCPLDRKQLVLLWMAEGFLDCSQGGKKLEELGDDCFAELLSRSLIQQLSNDDRGEKFVMHDLVNDLATFVSGKSCCRLECGDILENVRHFSYNQEYYDIFMKFEKLHNFKCLRSFLCICSMTWTDNYLSFKLIDDFLPSQKRLRVLSLSGYVNITKLPDSIGNLVQLRYLDISFSKIKSLPDTTCNLYNLQTLNLSSCWSLTELPVHIGNLVSLRHLDISRTNINEFPVEIGGLENLQTLTLFIVGKRHVGLSIKELRKFPNLQGKLTIKNLDNVVDAKEAHDANLKSKEKIQELELIWGKQSEESQKVKVVLDMLQPPINLKSLNICHGGTSFPSWLGNSSFSNMVSLRITNCEYCVILPPLGQLPSLKVLKICGMNMLETIGLEFYYVQIEDGSNSSFQPFPSLERINFDNMPNWNEWIPFEGIKCAFPQLRAMELHNCPELRGHLPSNLPCIEEIVIQGCSHLLETEPTLHWLSSIKNFKIDGLDGRTQLSFLGSDSPCMMQHAVIQKCAMLSSVPKLILRSTCLTLLGLGNLSSLTAFPSSGLPTSLQSLHIENCENLSFLPPETWSNYTSLVTLHLDHSCGSLTSFPLDGFPALRTLTIRDCRSLDSIYISERSSPRSSSLESLIIISHDSIELFEVKLKMDTLAALERLTLDWPELSFCEGVCLPPKLQSIMIQSKRTALPVTEWGLQYLTALSNLGIGKGDDIVNTLMKESLLPVSLVSLEIHHLSEMKSFDGNGLRHLSSLQHLVFFECRQLESLPENCLPSSLKSLTFYGCEKLKSLPEDSLPDSLKELDIYDCPLLEERYKRKEHCSKIAHIPVIKINDQVTI
ncbi:putative P-loop containing nucleoside triphosphate hydrolase, leucine-rich repeat domain, L [Medicago truncatula]|uniref:LRR and NB-ARC domain disease resistance protein n=1 Tax=Medicago truncatula TaxID=3880 RepID=G7J0T1_MEDTR|nr:putative disease resistance RPP13-like protein 1 [Medicago truncatula]XP_039688406.1 putative disease resistance RPP13-like protein 1 [Medicago truncatula]AES69651.2 LRR and NB-ARC domain disease resistance protein [Medicago truncatula]RHN66332.1 putative P-loop containing nucleoside triphosphate hydrolase, leucine-rich repeat domain, L [Medicago truncatula]